MAEDTKPIWAADCETDPFKAGRIPQPFIWGAFNGSDYREFNSTEQFIEFMREQDAIVYAHNGGKFDWHYLLDYIDTYEPLMVINGRLSKFTVGLCEFRDSYNILPMPLKAWEKDDFDYSILEKSERDKPANKIKISNYLKNDCKYLFDVVSQYIERYGMSLTQAGSALKVWEKIADTKAPKTDEFFYSEMSKYYYGGRVECFKTGIINHDFKVIDINSAYPFAMMHNHPYGEKYNVTRKLPSTTAYLERCFISLFCVSRGAFAHRTKTGLCFPNDNIRRLYHVSGWEYLAALDTNTISDVSVEEVVQFSESINFKEYIDHFYQMKTDAKENDDKAGYIFAKLFLNSLYGKFGANPDNYSEHMLVPLRYIESAEEDGYGYCAELGTNALVSKPLDDHKKHYYNIAVAASITGFVRAQMWRSINQCDGVIYCDTDSIACRDTGELALHKSDLGSWDVEANCNFGGIAGKKMYAFRNISGEWKTACKGVRLSAEEILKVARGDTVTYNPDSPSYSLKRGVRFISRKIRKSA